MLLVQSDAEALHDGVVLLHLGFILQGRKMGGNCVAKMAEELWGVCWWPWEAVLMGVGSFLAVSMMVRW